MGQDLTEIKIMVRKIKRVKTFLIINYLILMISLSFLISCGDGFETEQEFSWSTFPSISFALNLETLVPYKGWFNLDSLDSQLTIKIKFYGPHSEKRYLQVLNHRESCIDLRRMNRQFTLSEIRNENSSLGKLVLFLDSRMNDQLDEFDKLPRMRRRGSYYFSRSADLNYLERWGLLDRMGPSFKQAIIIIFEIDPLTFLLRPVACGVIN
jgi:hypothetical protein